MTVLRRATSAAHRAVLGPVSVWGRVLTVVGVVALLAGRRLGWLELVVAGCAALGVVLLGWVLSVGRSAYAVDLDLAGERVMVGEPATGRVTVRNRGSRLSLPAHVEVPVGTDAFGFPLPALAAGGSHDEELVLPTDRRAVVVVGPVTSSRGDPLGLVRRKVRWTRAHEVYVHPRWVSLAGATPGVLRDLEGQATPALSDADLSFHTLREYAPGDDRRHIHWRSTARVGSLMVRQFEDSRSSHVAVLLPTAAEEFATAEEFELAVSVAASVLVQAARDERGLSVLAGADLLRSSHAPRLLDQLSGIAPMVTGGPVALDAAAREVTRQVPHASIVVAAVGSVRTAAALRSACVHLPVGARVVLVRCCPGEAAAVQSVGGLSIATLGDLDDLARVLRRAAA